MLLIGSLREYTQRPMRRFENIVQAFCAHLLPHACIVCGHYQEQALCLYCSALLAENQLYHYECCRKCGITMTTSELAQGCCQECLMNPPFFDETYCLDRYDGILQAALHQLKYQRRLACAHGLAIAWNERMIEPLQAVEADFLFPVPLSQEKLCFRGFNQSWELARRIRCTVNIQKHAHVLMRHHHTQHQAAENRINRHKAIRDMFYVNPQYQALLQGSSIVIFDDVMTSGATLNEIARVLKDNGVSRVINWVLLRTQRPSKQLRN